MFLRQSTVVTRRLGPFVDSSDGDTAETGLTIAQADIQISKNGAAFAQKNAAGNAAHDIDGWYSTTFDATDTATVGELKVQVKVPGALAVHSTYYVLTQQIYDAIFGSAAGVIDANIVEINNDAQSAARLALSTAQIIPFTVTDAAFAPTSTQFETDLTEATADHYDDAIVIMTSGALAGQRRAITGYSKPALNGRFTVVEFTEAPANGDTGIIV